MKIDKKLIKELVENLKEFELTELEYQEGQTKIKVSKASKNVEQVKTSAVVSPNKSVLKNSEDSEGIRIKSPIIGTAYLAPEPGAKKFIKIGDKTLSGTLSGFIASFLIVLLINQSLLPIIILSGSIVAMTVELIPSRLNDNLTMPIISGLIMMYLETAL